MPNIIYRKLEMGGRVSVHCHAHPAAAEKFTILMGEVDSLVARGQALETAIRLEEITFEALQTRQGELVDRIFTGSVDHLARIARGLAPERPDLPGRFRAPSRHVGQRQLLTGFKAVAQEAKGEEALFVEHGLPPGFLAELTAQVAEYEEVLAGKAASRSRKVEHRTALKDVARQLMQVVRRLDGLNRLRYQNQPEQLAAWNHAKDVAWPERKDREAAARKVQEGGAQ